VGEVNKRERRKGGGGGGGGGGCGSMEGVHLSQARATGGCL